MVVNSSSDEASDGEVDEDNTMDYRFGRYLKKYSIDFSQTVFSTNAGTALLDLAVAKSLVFKDGYVCYW